MANRQVSGEELAEALEVLEGWEVREGKLHKQFRFPSFATAMGWMVSVAIRADQMDHHPEWSNIYNRVSVELVTHELGNVIGTQDLELAQIMDGLARGVK